MAITELYVDPSIAGDSGTGTVGDPYGDLEYCLAQATFDTTNGSRINIKSGTAEILSAALNLTANFTSGGGSSATAPLIFQGYASAAGDGNWAAQTGIGGIDCNNNSLFVVTTNNYTGLHHLEIFGRAGAGYGNLIHLQSWNWLLECEIHTHSGTSEVVRLGTFSTMRRCHVHSLTSSEIALYNDGDSVLFVENYINITAGLAAIYLSTGGGTALRNVVRVSGAVDGIVLVSTVRVEANSVWSSAGTGQGISGAGANCDVLNNVIEGFSGSGGVGIEKTSGDLSLYGGNHVYNCATNYSVTVPIRTDLGDNEDLSGSSPFANAGSQDMTPQDVGNMDQGAWPASIVAADGGLTAAMKMWKGALEPAEPAGGGDTIIMRPRRVVSQVRAFLSPQRKLVIPAGGGTTTTPVIARPRRVTVQGPTLVHSPKRVIVNQTTAGTTVITRPRRITVRSPTFQSPARKVIVASSSVTTVLITRTRRVVYAGPTVVHSPKRVIVNQTTAGTTVIVRPRRIMQAGPTVLSHTTKVIRGGPVVTTTPILSRPRRTM